jgi:hypothetical protein
LAAIVLAGAHVRRTEAADAPIVPTGNGFEERLCYLNISHRGVASRTQIALTHGLDQRAVGIVEQERSCSGQWGPDVVGLGLDTSGLDSLKEVIDVGHRESQLPDAGRTVAQVFVRGLSGARVGSLLQFQHRARVVGHERDPGRRVPRAKNVVERLAVEPRSGLGPVVHRVLESQETLVEGQRSIQIAHHDADVMKRHEESLLCSEASAERTHLATSNPVGCSTKR